MKKNLTIIILSLSTLVFMVYGYIKSNEAERNAVSIIACVEEAIKNAEEAQGQAEIATQAAADARKLLKELETTRSLLEKCQTK